MLIYFTNEVRYVGITRNTVTYLQQFKYVFVTSFCLTDVKNGLLGISKAINIEKKNNALKGYIPQPLINLCFIHFG